MMRRKRRKHTRALSQQKKRLARREAKREAAAGRPAAAQRKARPTALLYHLRDCNKYAQPDLKTLAFIHERDSCINTASLPVPLASSIEQIPAPTRARRNLDNNCLEIISKPRPHTRAEKPLEKKKPTRTNCPSRLAGNSKTAWLR
jgi:hypothetical protein